MPGSPRPGGTEDLGAGCMRPGTHVGQVGGHLLRKRGRPADARIRGCRPPYSTRRRGCPIPQTACAAPPRWNDRAEEQDIDVRDCHRPRPSADPLAGAHLVSGQPGHRKVPQPGAAEAVPAEVVLSVAVALDRVREHHPVLRRHRPYGMTSIQVRIISGVARSSNSG
jgi:hypothetical protein